MAAEYVNSGGVTRCRTVTRTVENGILHEVWGDFLPLTYCGHDGRVGRGLRNQTIGRDPQPPTGGLDLGDYVLADPIDKPANASDPGTKKQKPDIKFLLIAAAAFFGLVALVVVFKK